LYSPPKRGRGLTPAKTTGPIAIGVSLLQAHRDRTMQRLHDQLCLARRLSLRDGYEHGIDFLHESKRRIPTSQGPGASFPLRCAAPIAARVVQCSPRDAAGGLKKVHATWQGISPKAHASAIQADARISRIGAAPEEHPRAPEMRVHRIRSTSVRGPAPTTRAAQRFRSDPCVRSL
jgi:hypothetical protein